MLRRAHHPEVVLAETLGEIITSAVLRQTKKLTRSVRRSRALAAPRLGCTLRPGTNTPLWNAIREELRWQLRPYGRQAQLARHLGVPRQRVNTFVTGGARMPDAERTLELLTWLATARRSKCGRRRSTVS